MAVKNHVTIWLLPLISTITSIGKSFELKNSHYFFHNSHIQHWGNLRFYSKEINIFSLKKNLWIPCFHRYCTQSADGFLLIISWQLTIRDKSAITVKVYWGWLPLWLVTLHCEHGPAPTWLWMLALETIAKTLPVSATISWGNCLLSWPQMNKHFHTN